MSDRCKIQKSSIAYNQPATENVIEFLKHGLERNVDKTLLIDELTGARWTGKELQGIITRVAKFLIEQCALKRGDVCNLYQDENCINCILQMAIVAAGGVSVGVAGDISARNLVNVNIATRGRVVISNKNDLSLLTEDHLCKLEPNVQFVTCDELAFDNCKSIASLINTDCQQDGLDLETLVKLTSIRPDQDFCVIQFSSGTTGKPKGIPRTHKNVCHLVASLDHEELMMLKPGDVMGGSLSIFHRPGLWAFLASIKAGSCMVVKSNQNIRQQDIGDIFAAIDKYKITMYSCSLVNLPKFRRSKACELKDKYDLSSLRQIFTTGAKIIDFQLPKFIVDTYKLDCLRQGFGMTESGLVFLVESSLAKDRYLSVGHVVPGIEAIVIDPKTNEVLGPEQRGEIALRGPQIFPGYLTDKPGVFNRSDFTSDGWFKIGDEAYYTREGLFYIVGRYKEQLRFKNFSLRYYPDQIEAIVNEHPSVENSCVVKLAEVEDEYHYDVARVFVTLKPQKEATPQEIQDLIENCDRQVVIEGGVRILDDFPRMANSKINKQMLITLQ